VPAKPRRLAFIETQAWPTATDEARRCIDETLDRLKIAGIAIATRHDDAKVAAVEEAIANAHMFSNRINAWEARWFIRGARDRDAEKLSKFMRQRLEDSEALTLADYRAMLAERARIRSVYAALAGACDGCIALPASGPAPAGLQSTGNAQFAVPGSLLGIPALSLPLFEIGGMPLGLQVLGFANEDAAAFALSGWLRDHLADKP
jgi:Asp-tRNA(Asn)/Glu-tRNA(Gln) amidotransferase A subunit family amidase